MSEALLFADLAEEIRTSLGSTGIDVELEDTDIRVAIKQTLRIYSRNRPGAGRARLALAPSVKKYLLTHAGLQGVTHCQFLNRPTNQQLIDPFDPTIISNGGTSVGGVTIGEYNQTLEHREMSRRVLSTEPEWHGQWEGAGATRQYYLYVDVPVAAYAYECSYRFVYAYSDDESADNGLLQIPPTDDDLVIRFTSMLCKRVVGRKRSKFGGIANDQGSVDEADGQQLLEEARTEEETLMTDMKRRRRPLSPVTE